MSKSLITNEDFLLFCQLTKIGKNNTFNHINFYKSFEYLYNAKKFLNILKNTLDLSTIEYLVGYIDSSIIPYIDDRNILLDLTINDIKLQMLDFSYFKIVLIKFIDKLNYNYFLKNFKINDEFNILCDKNDCKVLIKLLKEEK